MEGLLTTIYSLAYIFKNMRANKKPGDLKKPLGLGMNHIAHKISYGDGVNQNGMTETGQSKGSSWSPFNRHQNKVLGFHGREYFCVDWVT